MHFEVMDRGDSFRMLRVAVNIFREQCEHQQGVGLQLDG